MNKIYVAGPMRGYKDLNFPEFIKWTERLREDGWDAVNPVELNPDPNADYLECMRVDIRALTECHAIFLLDGWENSEGANAELTVARMLDLKIYLQHKY